MATTRARGKAQPKITFTMTRSRSWEDSLDSHIKSNANMAAYQHARKVEAAAKRIVPQPPGVSPTGYVRTGDLRRSIKRVKVQPGHHRIEVTAKNSSGKDYGPFVEWGTRYMRAQPFLGPAIKEVRPKFRDAIKSLMKDWRP